MSASGVDVRRHILEVAHPLLVRKGFSAVGLAEVLEAAQVPKGSFYHYFGSKESFGEALLEAYFTDCLARMDDLLSKRGTSAQRLVAYFRDWLESQTEADTQQRCLVVKLGAEVCDLSENMRAVLDRGTQRIVARIARGIEAGKKDGSVKTALDAQTAAVTLYQSWLGASLLAKITRDRAPLDTAMSNTRRMLGMTKDG
ncbi:TetR family transcriptional regulator [Myxococcus stipitatus DSM 14675]|uniref:TetR family transcriptional regulator n=1 Tax=Myxococcus stipitatus (strain DSM 14675 / JCM 12634 / Mx s8) TaxID=1278073 RepID=L7UNS3_MYXSD|nr:TetR/AcrR family transcriptional regulator [Myxococcus stipitatus]AGC48134.1 TetR family transcriptional regulator [Myxococcus stipitatus DSM 14675]